MIEIKLDEVLKEKNMNINQLSQLTKIPRSSLIPLRDNTRKRIDLEMIQTIAESLNISENELINVVDNKGYDLKINGFSRKTNEAIKERYFYFYVTLKTPTGNIDGLMVLHSKEISCDTQKENPHYTYKFDFSFPTNYSDLLIDNKLTTIRSKLDESVATNQAEMIRQLKSMKKSTIQKISCNMIEFFLCNSVQRIGLYLPNCLDYTYKIDFMDCVIVADIISYDLDSYDFKITKFERINDDYTSL